MSPSTPTVPTPSAAVEFDVAIVGAGPAGAAAALEFGGRGVRVAIIEKAVPPRYKTCGGGVLRRAMSLLPVDVREAIERECLVAELVHHSPNLRFECRRSQPIVSMVMRDRFDHVLVTAAQHQGAQLFAGTTVTDVTFTRDRVRLATNAGEINARFVIAADGVNSIVARKTGRPALRGVVPALECEVTLVDHAMVPFMVAARFDFGLVPAGYGWVFPKRNHLSIGVGTTHRGAANLPQHYQRYLEQLGISDIRHEERHGYMIPCRPRARMFEVPRVLFAGDAAGLADPVTAEGITGGILSGQLAARAILAADFDDEAVRRMYQKTLDAALLSELRIARWLAWVVFDCPRLRAALFNRHGQRMSELMTQIVTGETSYSAAVRRPGHYWKLLRAA
ncbi:MAG: geranylgeranyl reductase family protein [Opitutaceae bacterium]|nr:geranylgeranyl reductase family protein [Opitutaceae bacterium]